MHQEEIREKCGIIGVWTANNHAPAYARRGLAALQHRGQESAGLSILQNNGKILTHKGLGLVPHVITQEVLQKLGQSNFTIGHNRYGTFGKTSVNNAQPLQVKNGKYHLSIGHNGNVPDITNIKKLLGIRKKTVSDTALMAALLVQERPKYPSWEETFIHVFPEFRGAYNLIILTNDCSLFGVRDPLGIRPLCLGKLHDGWIIASESVALDSVGAGFVRDVLPGELIHINATGKLTSSFFGEPRNPQYCIFENIYFARPDSFINGRRVRAGREESGRLLGERIKMKHISADVVIPTFDSGYPAAKGVAKSLNLPIVDAITTSHYVGRTFIQPGQQNRVIAVNGKHNIVADEVQNKHVIVVDDSAVRLTTSTMLTRALRNAGVKTITMAIASPPVVDQCDLGIDMRSKKELPAAKFEKKPIDVIEKKIAEHITAENVVYLPIDETAQAMGGKKENFYYFPFGGPHPFRSKQPALPQRKHQLPNKPRICIFISGEGTNLQVIIDEVQNKTINADIVGVLSNKKDAPGLKRAEKNHIPTMILPYDKNQHDEQLNTYIQSIQADVIILAGWMRVLGDTFLKEMQRREIPVINIHPALLTQNDAPTIATSRGFIPVLRGIHVIQKAYEQNLPVSGVTVHQVLPGTNTDTGPIICKAERRRRPDDTLHAWEQRIHQTEHLLLPTAIKKVLHVMQHNVDISKGEFSW